MIEYVESTTQDQKQRDMLQRYRNVFGTPEGRLVLGDILHMCHFGFGISCEEARIEYNVGIAIARMSGIFGAIDTLIGIREE
jgi:hypothetical protein